MKKLGKNQIGNCICAFMCLLVLITQFLPFWNCTNCKTHKEEDKMVSVAEYIWIPVNHTPITKSMTNVYYEVFGRGILKVKKRYACIIHLLPFFLPSILTSRLIELNCMEGRKPSLLCFYGRRGGTDLIVGKRHVLNPHNKS